MKPLGSALVRVFGAPPHHWGPITACRAIGYGPPGLVRERGPRPWRIRHRGPGLRNLFGLDWRQRERHSPWEVIDLGAAKAAFRGTVKRLAADDRPEELIRVVAAWAWLRKQARRRDARRERDVGGVPVGLLGL